MTAEQVILRLQSLQNHFPDLADGVSAQPVFTVERIQNPLRKEGRLVVNPPPEIIERLSKADLDVIDLVGQIGVIEYGEQKPGDLTIVMGYQHGEETLGDGLSTRRLDAELGRNATGIKGKVIIIPVINVPGYAEKTRYVFPDEQDTNINLVCDCYNSGDWE